MSKHVWTEHRDDALAPTKALRTLVCGKCRVYARFVFDPTAPDQDAEVAAGLADVAELMPVCPDPVTAAGRAAATKEPG